MAMVTDGTARTGTIWSPARAATEASWDEAGRVGPSLAARRHPGQRVWPTAAAAGGLFAIAALLALLGGAGCAETGNILPNSDPALRKPVAEFRADGVKRHPFKADAPTGGRADGAAQVNYTFDTLEVANFSSEHWKDVEIWVNRTHVVHVPQIDKDAQQAKTISFFMLVDAAGKSFPNDNHQARNHIRQVEMLRDGTLYEIKVKLAD